MSNLADRGTLRGRLKENTTDYNALINKPAINGHTLVGNKTGHELDLANLEDIINVEANPEGASSGDLNRIKIGTNIYEIPGVVVYGEASGAIATFTDGGDNKPLKSLKVAINPVQDLHGYDKPWSGGAGKNKLPYATNDTDSKNGITWTKNSDGSIAFSGTCTNAVSMIFVEFKLPAGEYLYSNVGSTFSYTGGNRPVTYIRDMDNSATLANIGFSQTDNGVPFTLASETNIRFYVVFQSGNDVSGVLYPMIRLSTVTDATYAPYSNICPISGWTGSNIHRADGETPHIIDDTYNITWSEAGTVYYGELSIKDGVCKVKETGVIKKLSDFTWSYYSQTSYFRTTNLTNSDYINTLQPWCEVYNPLPSITSSSPDLSIGWAGYRLVVKDANYTDPTTWLAAVGNYNVVIPLKEEAQTEYTLDPITITTLLGTNNIWSDTGEVIECVYERDLNIAINKIISG